MNPADNIEKLIKELRYKPSAQTHDRVLGNVLQALKIPEKQKPTVTEPNIWRIIVKSRITKLAAAAVTIIAVSFFVVHRGPDDQVETPEVVKVTKSPAEMMTAMSLNIAYRKGGMEAVEKQCDEAFKMLGPQPASISVQELIAELSGEELERTRL